MWNPSRLGRRKWHPTPVLLPGKSHGQRSLVGCSPWGREELNTTERLHFPFSLSCIGKGNGNPLQCSCLENPRDRGAWWAAVYGVAQSWTRLKRLSSSSSSRTVRRKFLLFKSPSFLIATPADRDSPLIFIIPLFLSYAAWFNLGWHWAHLTDYFLTSTEDTCDHKVNKMYARVLIRTSGYTLLKVHRKKKKEIYKYRYRQIASSSCSFVLLCFLLLPAWTWSPKLQQPFGTIKKILRDSHP